MGLMLTSLSGSSWSFSWIHKTQLEAPSTPDSLLPSSMDAKRSGSSRFLCIQTTEIPNTSEILLSSIMKNGFFTVFKNYFMFGIGIWND
jgi:hypothetical protein